MKNTILLLLLFTLSYVAWADKTPASNSSIDVVHYRFNIELNDTTDRVAAIAEITVLFKTQQPQLVLDLVGKGKDGFGMTVSRVLQKNNPIPFTHQENSLIITLPRPSKKGEQHIYTVQYAGIPAEGLIISKNKFGDRTFFSDNWPNKARYWIPSIDHPSDKASCEFIVTAPEHYQVVSNGVKIEQTNLSGQRVLTHWKEIHDLPTKVMAVGVARFAVATVDYAKPTPITTWVYPQNREEGFDEFKVTPKALDYLQDYIGPFPYQKIASIQSKTRHGGMENASAIFYAERLVSATEDHETIIAHELAHQWFGDAISEFDWPHIWLSEGFATYFSNVYMKHAHGTSVFRDMMRVQRRRVIDYYHQDHKNPVIDTAIHNLDKLLNANSYQKGGWVLHMLNHTIGDTAFRKGIRAYYLKYQHGNALTRDFRKVMEEASGKNLKSFFDQWLRRSGHPILSVDWQYKPRLKSVEVQINQIQPVPFKISLDVGVKEKKGDSVLHTVKIDGKTAKFTIPATQKPSEILLDPNVQLLFEMKNDN